MATLEKKDLDIWVITPNNMIAGTYGNQASMGAESGGFITLTNLTNDSSLFLGSFMSGIHSPASDFEIEIFDAENDDNNGAFEMDAVLSSTSVRVVAGSAPGDDSNNGSIKWKLRRKSGDRIEQLSVATIGDPLDGAGGAIFTKMPMRLSASNLTSTFLTVDKDVEGGAFSGPDGTKALSIRAALGVFSGAITTGRIEGALFIAGRTQYAGAGAGSGNTYTEGSGVFLCLERDSGASTVSLYLRHNQTPSPRAQVSETLLETSLSADEVYNLRLDYVPVTGAIIWKAYLFESGGWAFKGSLTIATSDADIPTLNDEAFRTGVLAISDALGVDSQYVFVDNIRILSA